MFSGRRLTRLRLATAWQAETAYTLPDRSLDTFLMGTFAATNYFAIASAFFSAVALANASLYDARSIA
jgi:hypothetical protein